MGCQRSSRDQRWIRRMCCQHAKLMRLMLARVAPVLLQTTLLENFRSSCHWGALAGTWTSTLPEKGRTEHLLCSLADTYISVAHFTHRYSIVCDWKAGILKLFLAYDTPDRFIVLPAGGVATVADSHGEVP